MDSPVAIYLKPADSAELGTIWHGFFSNAGFSQTSSVHDWEDEIQSKSPKHLDLDYPDLAGGQVNIWLLLGNFDLPWGSGLGDSFISPVAPHVAPRRAVSFVFGSEPNEFIPTPWNFRPFISEDDSAWNSQSVISVAEENELSLDGLLKDAMAKLGEIAPSVKSDLEALLEFPSNWDLEGGLPVQLAAVIQSANLLFEMCSIGQLKPSVTSLTIAKDGGVEITIDGTNGRELFLVVPPYGSEIRFVISFPAESGNYDDYAGLVGRGKTLACLVDDLVKSN